MKTRRAKFIGFILVLSFGLLIYRLAHIQLLTTEQFGPENVNLLEESVEQRAQKMLLNNGRGQFIDRNHVSLTHQKVQDIVFFPFIKSISYPANELASILDESTYKIRKWIEEAEEPFYLTDKREKPLTEIEYQELTELSMPGIIPVERSIEGDPSFAQHFLGVVREDPEAYKERIGVLGLENSFDPFLQSTEEEKLLYHVDAVGSPIFGLNVRYVGQQAPYYPVKLKTTLDVHLQKEAEEIVERFGIKKGGLVLLDTKTRDVLAMVSKPDMNPKNPISVNHMLTAYAPGSIFKTVIAAAAIEHPNVNTHRLFDCNKSINEGKKPERELGMLSFEESFAQSCNRTFAELAKEMMAEDPDVIENYARKLGLTEKVGWTGDVFHFSDFEQFPNENHSTIWGKDTDKRVPLAISQTAIGQLNVQLTPLSIANMMATIAQKGVKKEVRGVTRILYQNDATMTAFEEHRDDENILSSYNTLRLQELLSKVVEDSNGTGGKLKGLEVAGKSGTAEISEDVDPHRWFAGYFPYETPRYAMVVVNLNAPSSQPTFEVYKHMVNEIYDYEEASS